MRRRGGEMEMHVSVVVPSLDAASTLGEQLAALARQRTTRTFEVLVADNGSSDGTRRLVEENEHCLARLRWIDAGARTGSNFARNRGIEVARGEHVLLCDADDVVHEDWVEKLSTALDHADAVGGRLERLTLNEDHVRRWGAPTGQPGVARHLSFLPRPISANAGLRKELWKELGGFDERYVRGGVETEFFWRAQLAGHTLVDVPDAVVHYRMRSTLSSLVRQKYIWGRQSAMLYRQFRSLGMPRDLRASLGAWRDLVLLLPAVVTRPGDRLEVCRQGAYRWGRLVGSCQHRVFFP